MKNFKENIRRWLLPESDDTSTTQKEIKSNGGTITKRKCVTPRVFMVLNYAEAQDIANNLLAKQEVIVNVTNLTTKDKYRVIDFLSGVIYALEGKRVKLEPNIYLFSPNNLL